MYLSQFLELLKVSMASKAVLLAEIKFDTASRDVISA